MRIYTNPGSYTVTIKDDVVVKADLSTDYVGSKLNKIFKIDVTNSKALEYLDCGHNNLTELDVSNNSALEYLSCDLNYLTELDVSNNSALKYLDCYHNGLTELDVSNNSALEYLSCGHNNLTELDVSNNSALEYLSCDYNNLTKLDVSNNSALEYLSCGYNNDNFTLTLTSSQDEKLKPTGIGKVVLDSPSSEETAPTSLPIENDNSALYTLCKIIGCLILVTLSIILLVKIIKRNKKVKDDLLK